MRFRNDSTADREEIYQEWYTSPYLEAIYQYRRTGINPSKMEARIHLIYQLVEKGIMPWMWDHERYMDENKDMYGYFYEEDINAMLQIRYLESLYVEPKK